MGDITDCPPGPPCAGGGLITAQRGKRGALFAAQGHTGSIVALSLSRQAPPATGAPKPPPPPALAPLPSQFSHVSAPCPPVRVRSDGRLLASGSADMSARLWNAASGAPLRALLGHAGAVAAVAFTPDAVVVITGEQAGRRPSEESFSVSICQP